MDINLKLLVGLKKHSPTGEPEFTMQVPQGTTVEQVLGGLGIAQERAKVVLVNGRQAQSGQPLQSGDLVVVFPPMEGG
ncbi:MAG: MoaD/ThiS family protein [Desulfarculus sp.]|nr:MoaD/ThiS family protein [Pseudomonadota bacterium]MBU4575977.1 MoaD/ThiS family protein [Pseudomonadota bacterium]MBU4599442.1 MoaD/ThiS family protein [Pseudomonadota bacterium]MBV1717085.1 MoaD/ThiS family protein [Desulfarculus sp.]MBV1737732.1 MoaD/ThiS family protein [Desulfarculus sp.]